MHAANKSPFGMCDLTYNKPKNPPAMIDGNAPLNAIRKLMLQNGRPSALPTRKI